MNDPKATASARALAPDRILERGYGKPRQLNTTGVGQYDEHQRAPPSQGGTSW